MVTTRLEFGEWLRRQRERQGISLKAIADQTKVSASLFAALERGDCSRWPSGIYSRAWVRNYAIVVGLDPEVATERFSLCFAETAFPDPEPVEVEPRLRRWLRALTGLFSQWTAQPAATEPAAVAPPPSPVAAAPARRAAKRDRQVTVSHRLVASNVRRQDAKRVVSRRKRRRVERGVRRNAIA